MGCFRGLDVVSRLRSYRRYKPSTPVRDDPTAWWFYAVSVFYPGGQPEICRPKPTWDTAQRMARENVQYVQIYKKTLIAPNLALSTEEKNLKDAVEWDRELDQLKVLRQVSFSIIFYF